MSFLRKCRNTHAVLIYKSADIQIKSSTKVTTSWVAFLANAVMLSFQHIKMLPATLQAIGFMTQQSKENADTFDALCNQYYLLNQLCVIITSGIRYRLL